MAMSMQFIKDARALAVLPLVGAALAACGGNKVEGTESATVAAVPGGGAVVVETFTSSATVSALNAKDRKVTLQFADGKKTTFKASPDMVNYNQLQVGDQVNAVVTEQAVIWLSKNGGPPASAAEGGALLAPVGAKPWCRFPDGGAAPVRGRCESHRRQCGRPGERRGDRRCRHDGDKGVDFPRSSGLFAACPPGAGGVPLAGRLVCTATHA